MKSAEVFVHGIKAGLLIENEDGTFSFQYHQNYDGPPISLTMPVAEKSFNFDTFPPFFDGLLPEGMMLEGLIRQHKFDKNDLFSQLLCVGQDLVGAVTVRPES